MMLAIFFDANQDSLWPDGQERPQVTYMKWILILTLIALSGCASAKKQTSSTGAVAQVTHSNQDTSLATAAKDSKTTTSASALVEEEKSSCTKSAETRTLEIAKKGAGCELDYSKAGKTTAVATSSHGLKHCFESAKKIRAKLDHAGFKCT
jgi:uncharacterized protein YceK